MLDLGPHPRAWLVLDHLSMASRLDSRITSLSQTWTASHYPSLRRAPAPARDLEGLDFAACCRITSIPFKRARGQAPGRDSDDQDSAVATPMHVTRTSSPAEFQELL